MHGMLFIVWTMVGTASLSLAAVHGIVWLLDRSRVANLAFFVVAVAVAGMAATEFGMLQAASAAQYNEWLRAFHVALFFVTAGLVAFVRLHFRTGRAWLGWTVIVTRGVVAAGKLFGGAGAPRQGVWLGRGAPLGGAGPGGGGGAAPPPPMGAPPCAPAFFV